jgi:hypothetical protein
MVLFLLLQCALSDDPATQTFTGRAETIFVISASATWAVVTPLVLILYYRRPKWRFRDSPETGLRYSRMENG